MIITPQQGFFKQNPSFYANFAKPVAFTDRIKGQLSEKSIITSGTNDLAQFLGRP